MTVNPVVESITVLESNHRRRARRGISGANARHRADVDGLAWCLQLYLVARHMTYRMSYEIIDARIHVPAFGSLELHSMAKILEVLNCCVNSLTSWTLRRGSCSRAVNSCSFMGFCSNTAGMSHAARKSRVPFASIGVVVFVSHAQDRGAFVSAEKIV